MDPVLFEAVEAANEHQKRVLLRKVICRPRDGLDGSTVGVWGLAFKAGTDDMRESPAIPLIEGLLSGGARVSAHDPHAGDAGAGAIRVARHCWSMIRTAPRRTPTRWWW